MDTHERAATYISKMEPSISGSGGHKAAYKVAMVLCADFRLSPEDALPLMLVWNDTCTPPWTEKELMSKLKKAHSSPKNPHKDKSQSTSNHGSKTVNGIQITSARPKYITPTPRTIEAQLQPEAIRNIANTVRNTVNSHFLTNISPVDPTLITPHQYLSYLFNPQIGEKTIIFSQKISQGQCLWPDESTIPLESPEGVVFMANPVDGKYRQRDENYKPSRRTADCILSYKYILLESDAKELLQDWILAMLTLPLPIVSITTSGNKSIHMLIQCQCDTKKEWEHYTTQLLPIMAILGCDTQAIKNPVIMPRLPGTYRIINGSRNLQKLLYLNPYPSTRPLIESPLIRNYPEDLKDRAKLIIQQSPESRSSSEIKQIISQLHSCGLHNWANDFHTIISKKLS